MSFSCTKNARDVRSSLCFSSPDKIIFKKILIVSMASLSAIHPISHSNLAVSEDITSPVSLMENCKTMKELKQIHSQMIRSGLAQNRLVQTQIINFCCTNENGDMEYANHLFHEITEPNTFIWNTMMKGYSRTKSPKSAVYTFVEMLKRGVLPDRFTFPFALKAFTREMSLRCGEEFHGHIVKNGYSTNVFVQNALIHTYCLCDRVDCARKLFNKNSRKDIVSWNAMLTGYNRSKRYNESLYLFDEMMKRSVKPTSVSLVLALSACSRLKNLDFGMKIHDYIKDEKVETNLILENALLDMYSTCGMMDIALKLFENMKTKDTISWTAMITGFMGLGEVDQARKFFNQMPEKDIISWTAMIDGYTRASRFREALDIFRLMQRTDIKPDKFTMVSILTACAQLGALDMGEWIRLYIEKNKIKTDAFVGNALIDMYSKCGNIESALEVFRGMSYRDKFTWTAIILGLAVNGFGEEALDMFSEMIEHKIIPDEVTYVGVLSACTHGGMVNKGRELFSNMISHHGIVPNITHYGCMVDLLGRAGQLSEALKLIESMPMKPNSIIWGSLLGACRVHKNVKLAEKIAKELLDLEPENGAVYVLLSNIYAVCNRWEDVRSLRTMMTSKRIKKSPGCSLIEIHGTLHEFVAGDMSHPQSSEIYSKLNEMIRELKIAGYQPDKSEVLLDIGEEEKENALNRHSEKLAIAFGLINSGSKATIRIVKNLRMCVDCHQLAKLVSKMYNRNVIVRDRTRFHHFKGGSCSCKDYW